MKKKLSVILAILFVAAGLQAGVKLVWDANSASEGITGYNVYEIVGSATNLVSNVTTNEYVISIPGAHTYFVTSVNFWGESAASVQVKTPPAASIPNNVKAVKF